MHKIAPSLLAADFLNLGKDAMIVNKYADIFHLDVMDGVFVPNISFGFPVVEALSKVAEKPLDVHLMICNPEKYALRFAQIKGVEMISFHLEACPEPESLLEAIHEKGIKAGLVINPDCPVERLFPYLHLCDFVLIMSVFAGFGGQKFIPETLDRVKAVSNEIKRRNLDTVIEVDGGVSDGNSAALYEAGAEILVAGTYVFKAENPGNAIAAIR